MIAKQSVYLNADRTKAVPEGHQDARFLLVREGHDINEAELEKYGGADSLVGSKAKGPSVDESRPAAGSLADSNVPKPALKKKASAAKQ